MFSSDIFQIITIFFVSDEIKYSFILFVKNLTLVKWALWPFNDLTNCFSFKDIISKLKLTKFGDIKYSFYLL